MHSSWGCVNMNPDPIGILLPYNHYLLSRKPVRMHQYYQQETFVSNNFSTKLAATTRWSQKYQKRQPSKLYRTNSITYRRFAMRSRLKYSEKRSPLDQLLIDSLNSNFTQFYESNWFSKNIAPPFFEKFEIDQIHRA